jgi:hypothetical protein
MGLAQVLQNQMYGQGPNPAQNMLAQATGQNVAQQAALMAGQRGAGANAGLIARQAGQQGGAAQQQAAGQAATMGAQQQLGAQGALANVYGNVANQANQLQGIQQNALASQNQNIAGATANYNKMGMEQAQQNAQMNQGVLGGLANVGMKIGSMLYDGGTVPGYATGGQADDDKDPSILGPEWGKGSAFGFNTKFLNRAPAGPPPMGITSSPTSANITGSNNPSELIQGIGPVMGGEPGHQVSPGPLGIPTALGAQGGASDYLPFSPMAYGGSASVPVQDMTSGGPVPGQPPYPQQNTVKNDKIPAMLTSKEIVLPLTVTQSENPPAEAAKFVAQELQKQQGGNDFKGAIERSIKTRKK